MVRIIKWTAVAILGLAVTLLAAGLGYRAFRQHRTAAALAIHSTDAIDEAMFVNLGGVDQWIQIRGESRGNPVILVLHGGPGFSYVGLTPLFRAWEKYFTVVQWDRRGVGKTYGRNGPTGGAAITFDRMSQDGVELVELLRRRLHKDRVILLAHSVGSLVGVAMAQRRPDLFYAYVGTDQIVDSRQNEAVSYDMVVRRARHANDQRAITQLEALGPPPYRTARVWFDKQQLVMASDPIASATEKSLFAMVAFAPNYSLRDARDLGVGLLFSAEHLIAELMTRDVRAAGLTFQIPVFLIEGESDVLDVTRLAADYFATLHAPRKDWVVLPGAGHLAMFTRRRQFLTELVTRVRPLSVEDSLIGVR